jgi:hypothetical protein
LRSREAKRQAPRSPIESAPHASAASAFQRPRPIAPAAWTPDDSHAANGPPGGGSGTMPLDCRR